ncbi:MAG: trypsin-like peptidase domain-containing protein [Candidatus Pacebacteria bacterium]|nr:trypsin-like peptidase domain-containing protein [Candidatus Paceibacterota bacterium]
MLFKKDITKVIEDILPSVVTIIVSKSLVEVEKEIPAEMFPLLPFGMPEIRTLKEKDIRGMVQIDGGSGFVVDPNGVILTNKHVISDQAAEYTVIVSGDKKYRAEVIARDPINDIAILKIPCRGLQPAAIGDSAKLKLGQTVYAIGNPLGNFPSTVSRGIISGLSRAVSAQPDGENQVQELHGLIQTDTAINPGNSGGPLINENGEVIAINVAMIAGAQNMSFAIPINSAKRDLSDVLKFGKVKQPLLGLLYINIDRGLQDKLNLPVNCGALVAGKKDPLLQGVIKNTPAAKAGFKEGDIITECNGEKLSNEKTIQDFLNKMNPGDSLKMKVLRDQKKLEITVVLGERK